MLVYQCEKCGQLTIGGVVNEYGEHFCRERCYEEYCEQKGYEAHPEKLEVVTTALD